MIETGSRSGGSHPFLSFLYLLLLALAGALLFTVVAVLIGVAIYGLQPISDLVEGEPIGNLGFLKLLQMASTIGTFIFPAYFLSRIDGEIRQDYLQFYKPRTLFLWLTFLVMMTSAPLLELSVQVNEQMKLPAFLADLERWMRQQEDQMKALTKQLLVMNSYGDLMLNLLMIAVLPAIGEELLFRGCVQRIFTRWTKNAHWGIWIAAILFSAIHMQFYGFLPRMLLGALFGYLLLWSGSMWVPILAHFINNGRAVLLAFYLQQQGRSLDEIFTEETSPPWTWLLGLVLSIWILYRFRAAAKHPQQKEEDGAALG